MTSEMRGGFWRPTAMMVAFVAAGCGSGGGNFNLISIEEEWQMGAQLSQEVAKQVRGVTEVKSSLQIQP